MYIHKQSVWDNQCVLFIEVSSFQGGLNKTTLFTHLWSSEFVEEI